MAKKPVKLKPVVPIGTKAFAVSKTWIDKKCQASGAKVIPCKIVTYVNEGGEVSPLYKSLLGDKTSITKDFHYIYDTLEEAVEAIRSKPTKKK